MTDIATPREVIFYYIDGKDREPFVEWLYDLRDSKGRGYILRRLQKLKQGIYGDRKLLGEGVSELRFFSAPVIEFILGNTGIK